MLYLAILTGIFHGSTRHGEPPTHPERLVSFRPLNSAKPAPAVQGLSRPRARLPAAADPPVVVSGVRRTLGTSGTSRRARRRPVGDAAVPGREASPGSRPAVTSGSSSGRPCRPATSTPWRSTWCAPACTTTSPSSRPGRAAPARGGCRPRPRRGLRSLRDPVPHLLEVRRAGLAPLVVGRRHDPPPHHDRSPPRHPTGTPGAPRIPLDRAEYLTVATDPAIQLLGAVGHAERRLLL